MRRIKLEHLTEGLNYTLLEFGLNRSFQYLGADLDGDHNILVFESNGNHFKSFLMPDDVVMTPGTAAEAIDYHRDPQFYEEFNQSFQSSKS